MRFGKPAADRLLFFLAARRAAQDICFLALRQADLLHFHFGPHSRPVLLQQFCLKLLHLAARCPHQILAASFADRRQIRLAHDAAVKHPDPARLSILALYHAQDRLHRRDVGAIAVEGFVAEREAFVIDN